MLLHKHAQHSFFSFRKWRPWWQRQQGVQVERNAHKIANARRPPRSVNEAYAVLATEGARKLHLLIVRERFDRNNRSGNRQGLPACADHKTELRIVAL